MKDLNDFRKVINTSVKHHNKMYPNAVSQAEWAYFNRLSERRVLFKIEQYVFFKLSFSILKYMYRNFSCFIAQTVP